MNFLCPGHLKQLASLNPENIDALWAQWMNTAALHYEFQQWQQAASYIGCALELKCMALTNLKGEEQNNIRQLTLASIHLINCFEHLHEWHKAELCNDISQQILLKNWSKHSSQPDYGICLKTLMNKNLHPVFFKHYSHTIHGTNLYTYTSQHK